MSYNAKVPKVKRFREAIVALIEIGGTLNKNKRAVEAWNSFTYSNLLEKCDLSLSLKMVKFVEFEIF